MNYWIFKCNPQRFRIDERLQDPESRTTWLVTRYRDEIMPSDLAFVWRTGSGGGICAVMRVECRPEMLVEVKPDDQYWVDRQDAKPQLRVRGTFIHRFPCLRRDTYEQSGTSMVSRFSMVGSRPRISRLLTKRVIS